MILHNLTTDYEMFKMKSFITGIYGEITGPRQNNVINSFASQKFTTPDHDLFISGFDHALKAKKDVPPTYLFQTHFETMPLKSNAQKILPISFETILGNTTSGMEGSLLVKAPLNKRNVPTNIVISSKKELQSFGLRLTRPRLGNIYFEGEFSNLTRAGSQIMIHGTFEKLAARETLLNFTLRDTKYLATPLNYVATIYASRNLQKLPKLQGFIELAKGAAVVFPAFAKAHLSTKLKMLGLVGMPLLGLTIAKTATKESSTSLQNTY